MANPNIVNVATINGESQGLALGTGDSNVIIAAISSSKVVKVNRITITNVDGSAEADVSVKVVKAAFTSARTGGAGKVGKIKLKNTLSIPA